MAYMKDSLGRRLDTFRVSDAALRPDPLYQAAAANTVSVITPSEATAATITAQVIDMRSDARLRWHGVTVPSTDAGSILVRGPRKTDGTFDAGIPNYWSAVEFMVDCSAIEFRVLGFQNKYVLTVDGVRHTATNSTIAVNTGASRYIKFDFGGRKADGTPRRILFHCEAAFFKEIRLAATDTLFPVQAKPAPLLAILGDSYGTAYATRAMVASYDGYPQQLARLLGMRCNNQNAASNTGYIATNGATAGTFASRAADVIALDPALTLVQSSLNDYTQTAAAVGAAADALFTTLRAGLPNKLIAVTGILDARNTSAQSTNAAQNAAIQTAAAAHGVRYIDTAAWVAGTGKIGATTGDGNCDLYTYSDATHPTTAGGLYFASRLAGAIRAAVPEVA